MATASVFSTATNYMFKRIKRTIYSIFSNYFFDEFIDEVNVYVKRALEHQQKMDIQHGVDRKFYAMNYLVDPLHVFQVSRSNIPYLNLEPIPKEKARNLHAEAKLIQGTELWGVLQNTLRQRAIDMSMKNSTEWGHVLPGKMTVYALDIVDSVVDYCAKMDVDKLVDGATSTVVL